MNEILVAHIEFGVGTHNIVVITYNVKTGFSELTNIYFWFCRTNSTRK